MTSETIGHEIIAQDIGLDDLLNQHFPGKVVRKDLTKLVKEGKSEDELVAAKPFADLDAKWAPTELAAANFVRVVYHSLADKPDAKRTFFKRLFHRHDNP